MESKAVTKREEKKSLTVQDFKSLYYQMNAKPDTEVKVFSDSRLVEVGDIKDLHDRISEKLKNHTLAGIIVSIKVSFSDKRVLDLNSWSEFNATKWNTSAFTNHVEIQWDFNVVMPNYNNPQRHTLKVRIGTEVKPTELFQIMVVSGSDIQYEEAKARVVAKIDYINSVLSTELLNIVQSWYETLPLVKKKQKLARLVDRYDYVLLYAISFLSNTAGVLIGLLLLKFSIYSNLIISTKSILLDLGIVLAILWVSVYFFGFIGELVAVNIRHLAHQISTSRMFSITRGDKNQINKQDGKNNSIVLSVFAQVGIALIVNVILIIINVVFNTLS